MDFMDSHRKFWLTAGTLISTLNNSKKSLYLENEILFGIPIYIFN